MTSIAGSGRDLQVLADGFAFLEAPRFHDGLLYASDVLGKRVLRMDSNGTVEILCEIEAHPSGLGFSPTGELLIVSAEDHRLLRRSEDGSLDTVADVSALCGGPANDMAVDDRGGAYIGNYGGGRSIRADEPIAPANLVRVDPEGNASVAATDLHFPNGIVIDAAGKLLVVAESAAHRVTAFDIDADGGLHNRRVWAAFGEAPREPDFGAAIASGNLVPDGIALDADGGLWVADVSGRFGVQRILEGGTVTDRIDLDPGHGIPVAPALGGSDGRTLYLCAALPPFAELDADSTGSRLLCARVEVPATGFA
jgi:sugar lactone lactonase YvrE